MGCLRNDKKVRDGRLRFVLPTAVGNVSIRDDISETMIRSLMGRLSP